VTELLTRATLVYRLCQATTGLLLLMLGGYRVKHRDRLPAEGPLLLVANHQSYLDIPLLSLAMGRRHVCFVARDTLASSRFLAFIMRQCGAVLVRRGGSEREPLRAMMGHLEAGDVVAIFAEGTRTEDGSLGPFQKGALWLAKKSTAPVVPVGIHGTFGAWPRHRKLPRFSPMRVTFGDPIAREELGTLRERVAELVPVSLTNNDPASVSGSPTAT